MHVASACSLRASLTMKSGLAGAHHQCLGRHDADHHAHLWQNPPVNHRRIDDLDPLPYSAEWPSLMSAWGRVDVHSFVSKFLQDSRIAGAYIEFGVGRGRSAVSAYRAHTRAGTCDSFHLFDSFEGLPEMASHDAGNPQFRQGEYSFSLAEVQAFLLTHGCQIDAFEFVPGWFDATAAGWASQRPALSAAVVHVDVDLYTSAVTILEAVAPLLQPGTVMLYDDWNCFSASSEKGERRATREWLLRNPSYRLEELASYGWHGRAFVLDIV